MKILKAANPESSEKRKELKESIKKFASKIGKRNLVIIGSVFAVGLIVYLNWFLFSNPTTPTDPSAGVEAGADNSSDEDYFAVSALNRSRARDEAMEVLQTVIDAGASEEAAKSALEDISRIAADIEKEANIESLVKAKGFKECVAVISGDSINVIVKCTELLPSDIAQIKEIAYENADILPENVVITQK